MPFDPATATLADAPDAKGGFDPSTAKLVEPSKTAKLMASQLEQQAGQRWDFGGDIGRGVSGGLSAAKQDFDDATTRTKEPGFVNDMSRLGSAAMAPVHALGALTAPVTEPIMTALSSAYSYLPFAGAYQRAGSPGLFNPNPQPRPDISPQDAARADIGMAMMAMRPGARPIAAPPQAAPGAPPAPPQVGGALAAVPVNALSPEAMASAAGTVRPGFAPRINVLSPEGMAEAGTTSAAPNSAIREIVRRIEQDVRGGGMTAEEILAERAKAPDKPLTLADLGGENLRALAGNIARSPGEGRQFIKNALAERDAGAGSRVSGDVRAGISDGGTKYANEQALMKARSTAAAPLYDEAFAAPYVHNERIAQFTADPVLKAGLAEGMKIQRLEALADNKPFNFQDYKIKLPQGADPLSSTWLDDAKGVEFEGVPNLRTLDAGKRGLDAIVEANRDPMTKKLNQYGRAVDQVRRSYVAELDKATTNEAGVSPYAAARSAWSGPSASMDAMKMGGDILRTNPERIADDLKHLSPGDREFYKLGAADKLIEAIAKKGATADEAKVIIGNNWTQSQLRPLFATEGEFSSFINNVEAESRMHGTQYDVLGNSRTAARQAEDANSLFDAMGSAIHTGHQAMHGNYFNVAKGVRNTLNALGDLRRNPEINAEIARLMFEPIAEGGKSSRLLQDIISYKLAESARATQRASSQQNFMRQYAQQPQGAAPPPVMPPPGQTP